MIKIFNSTLLVIMFPVCALAFGFGSYQIQPAATNFLIWSRNLSNAAWVKNNLTAAQTSYGVDGVANSATRLVCTSTATSSYVCQILTSPAATRTLSMYVKRVIGTGGIRISRDGGPGYTDITSLLTTTGYTRVSCTSSQLNPTILIQMLTVGDEIDVDMVQDEEGASATNVIITNATPVSRSIKRIENGFNF